LIEFPLSRLEMMQIGEIENMFCKCKNNTIIVDKEYLRLAPMLEAMVDADYIGSIIADNSHMFYRIGDFKDFDNWVADQNRKARRVTKREWAIGIGCALIGALVPSVIRVLL